MKSEGILDRVPLERFDAEADQYQFICQNTFIDKKPLDAEHPSFLATKKNQVENALPRGLQYQPARAASAIAALVK